MRARRKPAVPATEALARQDIAPARRPMARAARVTLFEREVRERLSSSAIEILLGAATVLSEGERASAGPRSARRGDRFYGSTMLTIDLHRVTQVIRDDASETTARRVAALIADDRRITDALARIALREAARLVGDAPAGLSTEVRVRTQGATVFVDVDYEAVLP